MSHARGRGVAAALSRKAFTNGSSGMKSTPKRLSGDANAFDGTLAPTLTVRRTGCPAPPSRADTCEWLRLMDGDVGVGVDTAGGDVAYQDQHQKPELRPLMSALRFQGHDRAAGKIRGRRAVFSGQIACKTVEIAGRHFHAPMMAGRDEWGLN